MAKRMQLMRGNSLAAYFMPMMPPTTRCVSARPRWFCHVHLRQLSSLVQGECFGGVAAGFHEHTRRCADVYGSMSLTLMRRRLMVHFVLWSLVGNQPLRSPLMNVRVAVF
jgi:hypothetical protein